MRRENMRAHPVLLQMKYARIVASYASKENLSLKSALDLFYRSNVYRLMSQGISDFHCRSDGYLVEELQIEMKGKYDVQCNKKIMD